MLIFLRLLFVFHFTFVSATPHAWNHELDATEANNYFDIVDGNISDGKLDADFFQDYISSLVHDDPYAYDSYYGEVADFDLLTVSQLIRFWNKIVYNKVVKPSFYSIFGRSANGGCEVTCHARAICIDGICMCNSGFQGDGVDNCEDANECEIPGICPPGLRCLNLFGSHACVCGQRFIPAEYPEGPPCEDVDECEELSSSCHPFADCINTIGSYLCVCRVGTMQLPNGECREKQSLGPIVQCNSDAIIINVTKDHLWNFEPAKKAMQLNLDIGHLLYLQLDDRGRIINDCILRQSEPGPNAYYLFSIPHPFDTCTTATIHGKRGNSTEASFLNTLWWTAFDETLPFITMPHEMMDILCSYTLENNILHSDVAPEIDEIQRQLVVPGTANLTLEFWRFSPNIQQDPLTFPLRYTVGQILYVTVKLVESGIFSEYVRLDDCFASADQGIPSNSDVAIITKGCPDRNLQLVHSVIVNGEGPVASFSFQMFRVAMSPVVSVYCNVTLCKDRCKPRCFNRRKREESGSHNISQSEEQVVIRFGGVRVVNSQEVPASTDQPIIVDEMVTDQNEKIVENPHQKEAGKVQHSQKKAKRNPMKNLALPVLLILANFAVLILVGFMSYALARSITARRRLNRKLEGPALFSPTIKLSNETPCGGEETQPKTHELSFCHDKNCHFMKDIKGKNCHVLNKSKKKKNDKLKESVFKPEVYDTSTLTCPTPFNSPPPSPPVGTPTFKSTGTSPIKVVDENRNRMRRSENVE